MSEGKGNIDQFDAYLKDELSELEKEAFESALFTDEALRQDFEAYRKDVTVAKALGVRDELKGLMEDKKSRKRTKLRYWLPLGIAAVFIIILIALPRSANSPQDLFQEYFEPYPNAVSGRSGQHALQGAMAHYGAGKYEKAIEEFSSISISDTLLFYNAVSFLAINKPEEALSDFDQVGSESAFYLPTVWYKSLGFLLLGQSDSASVYLKKIEPGNVRFESAAALLNQLER